MYHWQQGAKAAPGPTFSLHTCVAGHTKAARGFIMIGTPGYVCAHMLQRRTGKGRGAAGRAAWGPAGAAPCMHVQCKVYTHKLATAAPLHTPSQ